MTSDTQSDQPALQSRNSEVSVKTFNSEDYKTRFMNFHNLEIGIYTIHFAFDVQKCVYYNLLRFEYIN